MDGCDGGDQVKLNRTTQPVVYRRVAIKTNILAEEARRAQLLQDIGILLFALGFIVFLFGILG
jgi:ABC-type Fe2+-enterobactin transport system substrate-binding protein